MIQNVDLASSQLCGYLNIQNLTEDLPDITTYFSAEIIGSRYGFIANDSWGSTETEDISFWNKFPSFRSIKNGLRRPTLTMGSGPSGTGSATIRSEKEKKHGSAASNTTFMRFKEHFLVPDHKKKELAGIR